MVADPIPEPPLLIGVNDGVLLADAEDGDGVAELDRMSAEEEDAQGDEVGDCAAEAYSTVTVRVFGWDSARGAKARAARRDLGVISTDCS